jgi:hypothetical protein
MSHIFISYAHDDKAHLDKVVAWLEANRFTERQIWYDHHIEGGSNWRDEITTALDEAFAIIVIITPNSTKSLYCTYEWAYAMGQGIPILPLVFDEVSLGDVMPPLIARQYFNCVESIPDSLKERVHRLKSVPPEVAALNTLIYQTIYDTHRRFFILGWAGDGLRHLVDDTSKWVLNYFVREASKAHQALQKLMLKRAFALNGRQYRYCWQLVDYLSRLSRLQPEYNDYLPEHLFADFESVWLPAFEYFEADDRWWSKNQRRYFEYDLDDEYHQIEVVGEMKSVFPLFDAFDIESLISRKKHSQKHESEQ